MLSVRVTAPRELSQQVLQELRADPTIANLAVVRGAVDDGAGDLISFEMARENANNVNRMLRHLGVPAVGSVTISEPMAVLSDAADRAEQAAPGHPGDGVVWAQLADRSREDARPSWAFYVFLVLAALIAGVGRYLDQPILIIGAMVVGPEFAPIAAICYALARRRKAILAPAGFTLVSGFLLAAVVSYFFWAVANLIGLVDRVAATTGPLTEFIVKPDGWSLVIALLAGVAGVLSMTSSKSSALVGVFISITTVPAVGTIGLTAAVGAWDEALASLVQLGINVVGLIVAGTITLVIQLHVGRSVGLRITRSRQRRRSMSSSARPGRDTPPGASGRR
ncbi:DUF389 domain-containing protein [Herbiconiux sp. CPCC 205763]|uniref:DUF389 domain-containing protein n=1 Tax=Herbiconiux aconitum TaxID=2970913 RepID=A0ABT2GWQ7_9MICO|nr:DUF389 domain-containing protein [Herbiconiux aconitum]MCS5719730.1 DUF389 domain-containing protein [Herbiconiux aconitum]